MATINTWDKLQKAQRDYQKPKFATQVVDKALKKQPKNAYLLTWKADLALQQMLDPEPIANSLLDLHKEPIADIRLLSYMYTTYLEAARRHCHELDSFTNGTSVINCWQSAAKTLQRRDDRMALWNALFETALRENVFDDVRVAVVNYNREAPPDKKQAHYSLILASQLSSEARAARLGGNDQMARIQADMTFKLMKQAFAASPTDPTAVKDIRDLRFMCLIFGRQGRTTELQELWNEPPEHLRPLFSRHTDDLRTLIMLMLKANEKWSQLEEHCRNTIKATRSRLELAGTSKSKSPLWELCAWRWEVWSALQISLQANWPETKAREIMLEELDSCFKTPREYRDRPTHLVHIKLGHWTGAPVLAECMEYFENHGRVSACFDDLRPIVENFNAEDTVRFMASISKHSQSVGGTADQTALERWQQVQANVMKFSYLFGISRSDIADARAHTDVFTLAIRYLSVFPVDPDISCLAVHTLLSLHHRIICDRGDKSPLETTQNVRILLQSAMLARHVTEKDKEKQHRTFALLAARLHLNLGLGTVAFRLFTHTKCKEMLLDTLSLYMFSRISQTHPFEVKSLGGFSADEELIRVIGAVDRMETKTAEFYVTDLSKFPWGEAWDIKTIKQKLDSSLTKHICSMERRRIARLKGEPADHVPSLDWKTYSNISDNTDYEVFPHFETRANVARHLHMLMPNPVPGVGWLHESHYTREHACQRLYNEATSFTSKLDPFRTEYDGTRGKLGHVYYTHTERRVCKYWDDITSFIDEIYTPTKKHNIDHDDFELFLDSIDALRATLEKLRMPGNTTLKPEDEPTMFHENMLMACYSYMEVLRATHRLIDHLRENVIKTKGKMPHIHKKTLPNNYDTRLLQATQICFQAVRDVAQSYIDIILRRGVEAIKAQVRWGSTGEALKMILSDEDVEYYAQEYVESALEAWKGVMKVKLK